MAAIIIGCWMALPPSLPHPPTSSTPPTHLLHSTHLHSTTRPLLQEMSETLGLVKLNERLQEPSLHARSLSGQPASTTTCARTHARMHA